MKNQGKSENKTALIIVGAVVLAVVIFWMIGGSSASPTVTAMGNSEMKVSPDEVSVYITIEGRGNTAVTAKNEYDLVNDKVVASLKAIGLTDEEIQQSYFNVYPEYNWNGNTQTLKGYVASSQVVIELEDFEKVADIVDAVINNGGFVSSINFELSTQKQSDAKAEALEKASADAKKKAEATAAGLGKRLGSLVSVQSSDFYYPGPIPYYAKAAGEGGVAVDASVAGAEARNAALNLAPQDISVSASVQVEYKLR